MLWTRRWRLGVLMLQCHGMSLFCVWTLSMPMIAFRACWRELWQHTTTSGNSALPYITICHEGHTLVFVFLFELFKQSRVLSTTSSWWPCWVFRLCLSIKVTCFNQGVPCLCAGMCVSLRYLIVLYYCTWITLLWNLIRLSRFCIHLYTNTIYCIKEKMNGKKWCL